jgi:nicotinate phosphoribosyltransferase
MTSGYRIPQPATLLTDFYQLTMAYGYWKTGRADHEAVFNLITRANPFGGGYTVACGLAYVIDFIEDFHFEENDIRYLETFRGNDNRPLFEPAFLDYLLGLKITCDIHAVPEGEVVFPQEPIVRVQGALLECQLLETPLLNMINFQTLIATKAARVCIAANRDTVIEFGLRRAQGFDGGLTASRAAYVGGCDGTSNVLAGKLFGIPVKGTHAHSWVMAFETEQEAFNEYARTLPNNCIFLVDTYDSLDGVRHAVEAGKRLREQGHEMIGIRLDSGDLAYLSREARKILDEGGFPGAAILASNDLDEYLIESLKQQGAAITVWGVGTRLVTANGDSALGGVYKLVAIRKPGRQWERKVKVSDQANKITTPGILQVRRFSSGKEFLCDAIYDTDLGIGEECTVVDPFDTTLRRKVPCSARHSDLLVKIFEGGRLVYDVPALSRSRQYAVDRLSNLPSGIRRLINPGMYPVGLEENLSELKTRLIREARKKNRWNL